MSPGGAGRRRGAVLWDWGLRAGPRPRGGAPRAEGGFCYRAGERGPRERPLGWVRVRWAVRTGAAGLLRSFSHQGVGCGFSYGSCEPVL